MTKTHATAAPGSPVFPPGRYGRRRQPRRRRPLLVGLVLVALLSTLSLITIRLYRQYGDPNYQAEVTTYTEITDNQIVIDFRVALPPGGSAVCVLRARSYDGADVGREQVRVNAPDDERQVSVRHRLATSARPFIGEVLRCRPAP